ncbi:hypothetical protein [Actinoplanes sp. NPDC020271]|uniref:hypothetical protein n=1 Tax=Actinoplanes sp. NPDC020271 TaxID=3363896 RepID=UPI0037BB713B
MPDTLHATAPVVPSPPRPAADILGVLPNALVDGRPADVIVLDRGLIVVPAPKNSDDGGRRADALLAAHSSAELAVRHRFLTYESVATARIERVTPLDAILLLHDGRTVTVRERWTAGPGGDALRKILGALRGR